MSPVASTRYGHQTSAWDDPLSFSQYAVMEVGGYIFNDRYQEDRVRVFTLDGLGGPDVRDQREPKPADHGEIAYDSFYGGRTYVISGEIQAGSLAVYQRLKRDLNAAFAPLTEQTLKLRWFDVRDDFDDAATIGSIATPGNYTPLAGALSNVAATNSMLTWTSAVNVMLMRSSENRTYGDNRQTAQVIAGNSGAGSLSLFLKVKDVNNYVSATLSTASPQQVQINVHRGTHGDSFQFPVNVAGSSVPVVGQRVWLRGFIEGDLVTVEYWLTKPSDSALPNVVGTHLLTGDDADTLGDGVLSQVGLGGQPPDTTWALSDYRIESIYPGDVSMAVKIISAPSIKDQHSLTRFKGAYQITLRSTDFRVGFATAQRAGPFTPTAPTATAQLGFTFPLRFPLVFNRFLTQPSLLNNILSVNNRGTVFVKPTIRVYGGATGVAIANLVNGQQIIWNGTIANGDYIVFDCEERTVRNSSGALVTKYLLSTSTWMVLEPGWNDLYVTGTTFDASTQVVVFFNGAYM